MQTSFLLSILGGVIIILILIYYLLIRKKATVRSSYYWNANHKTKAIPVKLKEEFMRREKQTETIRKTLGLIVDTRNLIHKISTELDSLIQQKKETKSIRKHDLQILEYLRLNMETNMETATQLKPLWAKYCLKDCQSLADHFYKVLLSSEKYLRNMIQSDIKSINKKGALGNHGKYFSDNYSDIVKDHGKLVEHFQEKLTR